MPALVVVFLAAALGAAFCEARVLVEVALAGVALAAAAFGADLVAALAEVLLLALAGEVDFVFLLDPNTLDQPSAYLLFVPTRVIVTFQFSWIKPKLSSRHNHHRDWLVYRQCKLLVCTSTILCDDDLLSISCVAVNP